MTKVLLTTILTATLAITGAAIADEAPLPTYFSTEKSIVEYHVIGVVPEGMRVDSKTSDVVTEGLFAGNQVEGIDYVLFRHDGVMVIDYRGVIQLPNGLAVGITLKGFMHDATLTPPFEAMLGPEFEFADVDMPIHGAVWFQTMVPEYAFLNDRVFSFTGALNVAKGEVRATYRSLVELSPRSSREAEQRPGGCRSPRAFGLARA